jgi:thioredoxin-related protein
MLTVLAVALLHLGLALPCESQAEAKPQIQWQPYAAGLAQAQDLARPILLNFTASWCKYCKMMKRETYADPAVIQFVNENFVPVRVDTQKDNKTAASYGVRSIPIIWFLTSSGERINALPGYVDAPMFLKVLGYIATGAYGEMDFETYLNSLPAEG